LSNIVTTEKGRLYVVEYNDEGELHDNRQLADIMTAFNGAEGKDVVLYVHGWHHNAKKNNPNYKLFEKFIGSLNRIDNKYIGIYVGWRGEKSNLLGIENSTGDFFEVKSRKKVALKIDVKSIDYENDGPPKMISIQSKTDWAINIFLDVIYVGDDPQGNSSAITHDLDTCQTKMLKISEKECIDNVERTKISNSNPCVIIMNNDSWVIRARKNRTEMKDSCLEANKLIAWVVAADDGASDGHNDILTPTQSNALTEFLEKTNIIDGSAKH
jgi:hypothetical protein